MDQVFKPSFLLKPITEEVFDFTGPEAQDVLVLGQNLYLSTSQKQLLSKGLTFIPTPDSNRDDRLKTKYDVQKYHRRIKLASHFKHSTIRKPLPFVGASEWSPSVESLPPRVQKLIKKDLDTFRSYTFIKDKPNLSPSQFHSIKELQECKHIVIKPADKGSVVVIMHRDNYILEVERQLSDTQYYTKLDKLIFRDTIPMVDEILTKLKQKKFITQKQLTFLKGDFEPRERRFYTLPKIHKKPETWTVPHVVPAGRPIVSDCGSETYHTAKFIDYYLNPLSVKHPAYVKDTYHFISIIKNLRPSLSSSLFSMDVTSLYTNIDITAGILAVKQIFEKYPDSKRPDEELLQLLDINLRRNDFVFNGKNYLQIKGTAMGKTFAPSYANIFMAKWEEEVLKKCTHKPTFYCRYLDDIFGIWEESKEEFDNFLSILNSHDASIQLKAEFQSNSIDFLDTTVFKGSKFQTNNKLDIKVFFKATDTHALLHKNSFHPKHTFRGVVQAQILRFHRICTRVEDFRLAIKILFSALQSRNYSRSFLRKCLKAFHAKKQKIKENILPITTDFNSATRELTYKLKLNYNECMTNPDYFSNTRMLPAYRRNPNLGDIFVNARLPSLTLNKPQLIQREAKFIRLKFITNSKDDTVIPILQNFSPRSQNCIYVLLCIKCKTKYVGQTKNTLSTRMIQHRYNLKNKKEMDTLLVQHFMEHGIDSIRMAGLQKNANWSDSDRFKMERRWIYRLGTKTPFGLNTQLGTRT